MTIKTAMILAAGLGKRMLPLTEKKPKPLIKVHKKPMLDWVVDHLKTAGVEDIIINTHYLADQIEKHVKKYKDIRVHLIHEKDVLETGGGIKNAIKMFPDILKDPFFVLNSDSIWLNGPYPSLKAMEELWDPKKMDALLLLTQTITGATGAGMGDFTMLSDNRLQRRKERYVAPFMYMGTHITHPKLFEAEPEGKYSLNPMWDKLEEEGRLWGILHDGPWYHVGTPEELQVAERKIAHVIK